MVVKLDLVSQCPRPDVVATGVPRLADSSAVSCPDSDNQSKV